MINILDEFLKVLAGDKSHTSPENQNQNFTCHEEGYDLTVRSGFESLKKELTKQPPSKKLDLKL